MQAVSKYIIQVEKSTQIMITFIIKKRIIHYILQELENDVFKSKLLY